MSRSDQIRLIFNDVKLFLSIVIWYLVAKLLVIIWLE